MTPTHEAFPTLRLQGVRSLGDRLDQPLLLLPPAGLPDGHAARAAPLREHGLPEGLPGPHAECQSFPLHGAVDVFRGGPTGGGCGGAVCVPTGSIAYKSYTTTAGIRTTAIRIPIARPRAPSRWGGGRHCPSGGSGWSGGRPAQLTGRRASGGGTSTGSRASARELP